MVAERTSGQSSALPLSRVAVGIMETLERIALGGILLLSAVLQFWRIGSGGYPNTYYAASIRSQLENWHNFFFNSFDPAGFVTIDKPPLGFWLQTLSAKIFGFHPWSVLLPEALAAVGSVALLYFLVARIFGAPAGLLAALALAVVPINVVTGRNNVVDDILVFTVLLSAWAVSRAVETGSTRWLVLGAFIVGLGFNVKMLEAYLVLPAVGAMYLFGSRRPWLTRAWHLLLAALVLAVVSASWITIVDLTPAADRPWVGSTTTNSEWDLAIGYNGLQRLNGRGGGNFGGGFRRGAFPTGTAGGSGVRTGTGSGADTPGGTGIRSSNSSTGSGFQPGNGNGGSRSQAGNAPGGAGASPFLGGRTPGGATTPSRATLGGFTAGENGAPGPLRLFNQQIGTQVSWLLPLAIIGFVAAAAATRPRWPLDLKHSALILWGMWVLTQYIFFSKAQFFHVYYMVMMTPAICALFGIGIVALWQRYREGGVLAWLLPLALLLSAAIEIAMVRNTPNTLDNLPLAIGIASGVVAVALVVARLARLGSSRFLPVLAAAAGIVALIGPGVWSQNAVASGTSGGLMPGAPFGGGRPNDRRNTDFRNARFFRGGGNGGPDGGQQTDPKLIAYLNAHTAGLKYYVAGMQSMTASPIIIATGKPAIALGGFSGSDPIVTVSDVQRMVSSGQLRYFLLPSRTFDIPSRFLSSLPPAARERIESRGGFGGGFGFGRDGQNGAVQSWVSAHCSVVPSSQWRSTSTVSAGGRGGFGFFGRGGAGGESLYDCASIQ